MPCDPNHATTIRAVGGGRGAGVGGLDVALVARLALRRDPLPADLAGALVDRVEHPALRRSIVGCVAVAVEPGLERRVALGSLIALVTKIVSPQTIGLECASPGIGVRHRMFSPVAGFHVSGRFCLSLTPDASRPRNDGQSPGPGFAVRSGVFAVPAVRTMRRAGRGGRAARRQPSAAIEDHHAATWHSSATTSRPTLDRRRLNR